MPTGVRVPAPRSGPRAVPRNGRCHRAHSVLCVPLLRREQVLMDKQVLAHFLIHEYEHPSVGRGRQAHLAARFARRCVKRVPRPTTLGKQSVDTPREPDNSALDQASLNARAVALI